MCWCFPTVHLTDTCGGPARPPGAIGIGGDAGVDGGNTPPPTTPRPRISGWHYTATTIDALPTYTHVIATGTPVGISSTELVNYVTNGPDSLRGVDLGTPSALSIDLPLPRTPFTLETAVFAGPALDPRSFEAVVGEAGRATWYTIRSGAIFRQSPFDLSTTPASLTLRVTGTSFHPLTDSGREEIAIAAADPPHLFYFTMDGLSPSRRADVSISGPIVGVTTGPFDAWVATGSPTTPNRVIRFATPTLSTVSTGVLPAIPLGIDGGGSLGTGNFIVVVVAGTGTEPPQLRAYAGGAVASAPFTQSITMGTPVGVHTSVIDAVEYAWVATTGPNTIQRFRVTGTGISPLGTIALPQEPIDFLVAAGTDDDDEDSASYTPFVHVLMR
jgi:hypothetical protein